MSNTLFNRLEKTPAYKIVADHLQQAILSKKLHIGEALPTEGSLADQFGLNRSTIREGIRYMEQLGLLTRQGKKLIVTRPSFEQVGEQMSQALAMNEVTFNELWEVKMSLEPLAAELAAAKITPEQLAILEENLIETEKAVEKGEADKITILDIEFHDLIAKAAGNKALMLAREANARLFYPTYQTSRAADISDQRLLGAHKMILESLRQQDSAAANEWMQKHIKDFKRGYELSGNKIDDPVQI